jgi:hypothetical protein
MPFDTYHLAEAIRLVENSLQTDEFTRKKEYNYKPLRKVLLSLII